MDILLAFILIYAGIITILFLHDLITRQIKPQMFNTYMVNVALSAIMLINYFILI